MYLPWNFSRQIATTVIALTHMAGGVEKRHDDGGQWTRLAGAAAAGGGKRGPAHPFVVEVVVKERTVV